MCSQFLNFPDLNVSAYLALPLRSKNDFCCGPAAAEILRFTSCSIVLFTISMCFRHVASLHFSAFHIYCGLSFYSLILDPILDLLDQKLENISHVSLKVQLFYLWLHWAKHNFLIIWIISLLNDALIVLYVFNSLPHMSYNFLLCLQIFASNSSTFTFSLPKVSLFLFKITSVSILRFPLFRYYHIP